MNEQRFLAGMVLILVLGAAACGGSGSTTAGMAGSGPKSVTSFPTTTGDLVNSMDGDGFLWGTEGNVNTADAAALPFAAAAARAAINTALRTKYVKLRISRAFFSPDGIGGYSPAYCLPRAGQCSVTFDMDEIAKLYQANGWSMVPMLRIDEAENVTTALIDDYVDFVDWFVGRYKAAASIEMIELVNAPAPGGQSWKGTNAQVVELMNKTYDRIKANYPDVAVGSPGFEYWVDSIAGVDGVFVDLIEYVLDKNNGARFDFWAFHGYPLRERIGQVPVGPYPPTRTPAANKYANVAGILQVRAAMDANGWQDRKIIDTEHDNITEPGEAMTAATDALDAAYVVQELVLKRTLQSNGVPVVAGALPLKMAPRGTMGEAGLSSLNADGTVTHHVQAMALLWSKLRDCTYAEHVSGAFDDENHAWVERFTCGAAEMYIFFKPFHYVSGTKIALDNEVLPYTLTLPSVPASAILTTLDGATSNVAPAQDLVLDTENSPKFLEVAYP